MIRAALIAAGIAGATVAAAGIAWAIWDATRRQKRPP